MKKTTEQAPLEKLITLCYWQVLELFYTNYEEYQDCCAISIISSFRDEDDIMYDFLDLLERFCDSEKIVKSLHTKTNLKILFHAVIEKFSRNYNNVEAVVLKEKQAHILKLFKSYNNPAYNKRLIEFKSRDGKRVLVKIMLYKK